MQNSKFKIQNVFLIFCILSLAFFFTACSVPILEKPECTQARQQMKDFYSFHFGHEMQFTPENLRRRERFLTPELVGNLQIATVTEQDPFTLTTEYPKAFRVGGCEVIEKDKKVNFEVLLFWRIEEQNKQQEIYVEAIKENDKWLINKIFNK
jgi:hypothetical protein